MTAPKNPQIDVRIAFWPANLGQPSPIAVLAALAIAVLFPAGASSLQGESQPVERRTVSDAAQPCLNLRQSPSYPAPIIGCLEIGSEVVVTGADSGWSRVSTAAGEEGWVGTRLLDPQTGGTAAPRDPTPSPASGPPPIESDANAGDDSPARGDDTPAGDGSSDRTEEETSPGGAADGSPGGIEAGIQGGTSASEGGRGRGQRVERLDSDRDRLASELAEAEGRIAELEAELAATRRAWAARSQEQESLARQVAELTAERDVLSAALIRAEARQLYLQRDLESTRAELMQLKGVPSRLVVPEPEPPAEEEAAAPAEPETAEAPAPSEPSAELDPAFGTESYRSQEVAAAVRAWAGAWSDQRVEDYLSFYAPGFQPPDGQSRAAWEETRRQRLTAPRSIQVTLDRISSTVSADRAVVFFEQSYVSDSFRDVVNKRLVLELIDGVWRIVEERVES